MKKDIVMMIGNVTLKRLDVSGDVFISCMDKNGAIREVGRIERLSLAPLAAMLKTFSDMSYVESEN